MPIGPNGEKRPYDVVANAVLVAKIAIGEAEDEFFLYYNFCRIHQTLRVTPAMEAGLDHTVRDPEWIIGLIDARAPKSKPRGPHKKRAKKDSNSN